jgi:hypothetical protein
MTAEQMLIGRIGGDSFGTSFIDVEPSMIIELMEEYASSKLTASKSAEEIFNTIPYLDRVDDYFNMPRTQILEAMEQYAAIKVSEASGWISVKDILPKPETEVLILNDGFYGIGEYRTDFFHFKGDGWIDKGSWNDIDGYEKQLEVTHWMPIPEPPKNK